MTPPSAIKPGSESSGALGIGVHDAPDGQDEWDPLESFFAVLAANRWPLKLQTSNFIMFIL